MGVKDLFRRMTGKGGRGQRGVRGARMPVRRAEDATVQIAAPQFPGAPQQPAPMPPAAPQQPPIAQQPMVPPLPHAQPAAQQPMPAEARQPMPAPPVAAPPQSPQPAASSGAATQYVQVPNFRSGTVTAVLVAIDGELEGEVFRLFDGENKMGRADTCQVVLPSLKISREHASILHDEGDFMIVPQSDKNPTIVNGEQTDSSGGTMLSDGDVVKMGRTTFRFRTIPGL